MEDSLLWLPDIKPRHQITFGSKATNLGLIARISRTANGFCLSSEVYFSALKQAGILEKVISIAEAVQTEDLDRITEISQAIAALILGTTLPTKLEEEIKRAYTTLAGAKNLKVAVRSSAASEDLPSASFAGQMESYLNVETFDDVIESVKSCWASLWSPRAIHYRFQKGISQPKTGMAVIIQEMVPAQVAGVMFTANPLTNSRKEIYIEAVKGLGESLVQGEENGDRYILDKEGLFIKSIDTVQHDAYLTDFFIRLLANEGIKLEYNFFDACQDVEWAFSKGEIYILQSRPITTLADEEADYLPEEKMTRIQRDIWTNVNERFPEPVLPIDSVIAKIYYLSLFEAYRDLGFEVPITDWHYVERGIFPDFFTPPAIRAKTKRYLKLGKMLILDIAKQWKINEAIFDKYLKLLQNDLIKTFPMEIILEYLEDALKDFQRTNTFRYLLYIQYGAVYNFLGRLLRFIFGEEGLKLHEDLVSGQPQITMELNERLMELAGRAKQDEKVKAIISQFAPVEIPSKLSEVPEGKIFLRDFEAFLSKYGDREVSQGLGGIAAYTWCEKPEVVWGMLKGSLLAKNKPKDVQDSLLERRKNAEVRLGELISAGGIKLVPFRGLLKKLIDYARKYTAFREDSHFYLTQAMPVFRSMFMAIGKQLVTRGVLKDANDVMYFTYWELKDFIHAIYSYKKISKLEIEEHLLGEKQKLERRKKRWLARDLQVELTNVNTLQGIGASSGKASGVCRIIINPEEFSRLQPGDILVAQYTNPSWTPVFSFIGGLVVEYGSVVSHAAIIAREYGIPAILGVKGVTQLLKDGEIVTIDGAKGLIQRE